MKTFVEYVKHNKFWLISGLVGLVAGWWALNADAKSAAAKFLARKVTKEDKEPIRNECQSSQNIYPVADPQDPWNNKRAQDSVTANKAGTFSGAWKVLPQRNREESIIFASVTSVAAALAVKFFLHNFKIVIKAEPKSFFTGKSL